MGQRELSAALFRPVFNLKSVLKRPTVCQPPRALPLVSGEVGAVTDGVFCRQTFWAVQKTSFIKWAGRAGQGSDESLSGTRISCRIREVGGEKKERNGTT